MSTTEKEKVADLLIALDPPIDPGFVYPVSSFPDLKAFESQETYCALIIPAGRTAELRNSLTDLLLHIPRIKNVYASPSQSSSRILVLKQKAADQTDCNDIYKEPAIATLLQDSSISRCTYNISRNYEDWSAEEVLKSILPHETEVPCAFEIIGHLAHVNLREEVLPFKYIVGKVILDKNKPQISTVVNKIGSIENEFRTFEMECIAGGSNDGSKTWNSIVQVREEKCTFELDFRRVYWNSRLGFEHRRLVRLIQSEQKDDESPIVVADVMAGVGPFAVPLTSSVVHVKKKKSKAPPTVHKGKLVVHANDLNPSSYHYLNVNSNKNKCQDLYTYNMDGRAFIHDLDRRGIQYDHVIMNLPAIAPEFLDAFRSCPLAKTRPPRIHVYCFGEKEVPQAQTDAMDRCSKALACTLDKTQHNVSIHVVRNVSPKKNMLCVSFTLPQQVADVPRLDVASHKDQDEPKSKRLKATET